MIHIHARRPDGTPSFEIEDFRAITEAIREQAGDVIINYSTGAIGVPVEQRLAYLRELRPDVAALNMGSMNYAKYSRSRREFVFNTVFANPFDEIIELLTAMNELGHQARARVLRPRPHRRPGAARPHGGAADAAARRLRHGRRRRRAADRAQPRRDGRQHPGRPRWAPPLGRHRHQPAAVDADQRGARARRVDPRRPGGQLLPAGRHDGPLQRRPRRQGARDGRQRRAAPRHRRRGPVAARAARAHHRLDPTHRQGDPNR